MKLFEISGTALSLSWALLGCANGADLPFDLGLLDDDAGASTGTGGTLSASGGAAPGGSTTNTGGVAAATGGTGEQATGGATVTSPLTGGTPGSGGARVTGGAPPTGGAKATGGNFATGGAKTTGGSPGAGGVVATGGNVVTGGARATGGAASAGATSATGGLKATGGRAATGGANTTAVAGGSSQSGCNFTSASCPQGVCNTLPTWEQTYCQGLLTCLGTNASCITAADPLCSTKGQYNNPMCTDLYNISTASRTTISAFVTCACGL